MPQRVLGLAVAGAGVVFVLFLVLLRSDLAKSAEGPRWRRRLLAAGVLCLASLGLNLSCSDRSSTNTTSGTTSSKTTTGAVAADQELTATVEWQRVTSTRRQAEEIASGKKGPYPFDAEGKKKALQSLAGATTDVASLQTKKLLSDSEAGLLAQDLKVLTIKVGGFRSTEMRAFTCYEPMPLSNPVQDSAGRLSSRLPLLQKLAVQRTLHPAVLAKVLANVKADLAVVRKRGAMDKLAAATRKEYQALSARVASSLKVIEARER